MEFSSDLEMRKLVSETREFFEKVLYDEEPLLVSDEATILDVSMSSEEELVARCSHCYGKTLSKEDLHQPLWKLLRQLNEGRIGT